jgi:hypothetical protein
MACNVNKTHQKRTKVNRPYQGLIIAFILMFAPLGLSGQTLTVSEVEELLITSDSSDLDFPRDQVFTVYESLVEVEEVAYPQGYVTEVFISSRKQLDSEVLVFEYYLFPLVPGEENLIQEGMILVPAALTFNNPFLRPPSSRYSPSTPLARQDFRLVTGVGFGMIPAASYDAGSFMATQLMHLTTAAYVRAYFFDWVYVQGEYQYGLFYGLTENNKEQDHYIFELVATPVPPPFCLYAGLGATTNLTTRFDVQPTIGSNYRDEATSNFYIKLGTTLGEEFFLDFHAKVMLPQTLFDATESESVVTQQVQWVLGTGYQF